MSEHFDLQKAIAAYANVSIWLESYNDIFSDFDSRPFHERSLSDDFIHEARKMAREKPDGKIELHLIMPSAQRNVDTEAIIIKSLHSYFRHLSIVFGQKITKTKKNGFLMTAIGFALMSLAMYLSNQEEDSVFFNTFRVLLEPACWFLVWTGFDQLYSAYYKKDPDYEFNLRMSHSKISFQSY
jgi:hypothetical protein